MRAVQLDGRLSAVADLISPDLNRTILDVGTDHALLPCFLRRRGYKRVIASDIGENPLKSAEATLESYGVSGVELVLAGGTAGVEYADDVVIAGMGGETIAEIISDCKFINADTRFILQPMTRHAELRRALYRMGLKLLAERAARADGRIYTAMLAEYCGESKEIDDFFAFTGLQTDKEYLKAQLMKVRKMLNSKPEYCGLITKMEAML